MIDLSDVITEQRIKAYCDLTPEWQADALADAHARAMRGSVNRSRYADDIAQCAAVYAATTLATMGDTATREERKATVDRAFSTLAKRLADDDAIVDVSEPIWRDRLVAGDNYSPDAAYADTSADLAHVVLAGADDRTRSHLALAARTPLADDKPAKRVRGSGYVMPPDTVGRMGKRLREATNARKTTAESAMARALADAATVASHGLTWLTLDRRHAPWPADMPQLVSDLPPFSTPDPTEGCARPAWRNPGSIASPVTAIRGDTATVYCLRDDEDGNRERTIITTAIGPDAIARLLATPWPITEGSLAESDLDRIGNAYVAASTGKGKVKTSNPRKGNRRGSMGPTVPTRTGRGGGLLPAGDMRPSVRPFRTGNDTEGQVK